MDKSGDSLVNEAAIEGDPLETIISWTWYLGEQLGIPQWYNSTSYETRNPDPLTYDVGNYTPNLTVCCAICCNSTTGVVTALMPPEPEANFTAIPTSGRAPLEVNFNDTSTNSPTNWSWSFGDGGTSSLQNPIHNYTEAGTYTVSMTASNAAGSNTSMKRGLISVTGDITRFIYAEAGESGCAETDVRAFHDAIIMNNTRGWQNANIPLSLPIYNPEARVKHWADGSVFPGGQSNNYLNKADFAYFHAHGGIIDNLPSIDFNITDPDGVHNLTPSMAKWGYEIPGSRIKWITLHSCLSLNEGTQEEWRQSFYGLHSLLGYDTLTTCAPRSTGEAFAQLMKGDYPGQTSSLSIWNAWIAANQETMDTMSYKLGMVYVIGCENDYLPGFGNSALNCNPQRNAQGNYDFDYLPYDPETFSYTSTEKTLQKTEEMKKTDGIFSIDTMIIPVPEKIQIYAPVKPDYAYNQAEKISRGFSMSDKKIDVQKEIQKSHEDQRSPFIVLHHDARIITYVDSERDDFSSDKIKKPLSDSQAVEKVTDVLTKVDLMPSDAVIDASRHHSEKRITKSGLDETTDERTTVFLHREMDGLIVENSNIIAEVRDSGKISQLFMNWRDYEPYKEADTKSAESAFMEFKEKPLQYHSDTSLERVVVTDITLRYYSQPPAITEQYLQPVYVFEGYVETNHTTKPFDPVYISATTEQFDRIPEGC
ncbi:MULTISPECIES: DUF6345 domain-containing protein [unclassified Methanoregula]|uniref:DUF6345 domain-containing protein n=1 Tax=unclassified Methanoregula TaxID=2649730 RepID=UPI0025FF0D92|nr:MULTISPECIES: DUF6345 domain-containing protein [unclassified Methanoregula]